MGGGKGAGQMKMKNRLGGHTNSYHTYGLEESLEGIAAAPLGCQAV
jgi:hypothetical protein